MSFLANPPAAQLPINMMQFHENCDMKHECSKQFTCSHAPAISLDLLLVRVPVSIAGGAATVEVRAAGPTAPCVVLLLLLLLDLAQDGRRRPMRRRGRRYSGQLAASPAPG